MGASKESVDIRPTGILAAIEKVKSLVAVLEANKVEYLETVGVFHGSTYINLLAKWEATRTSTCMGTLRHMKIARLGFIA